MAKTQVKQSNIRRVVKRVKRNVQACLGVMCATLLLVAALPMPSDAVGEGTQDGPAQANPVVVEAPAATPSDGGLPDDALPDDAVGSDGALLNVPVSDVAPDESVQEDSPMQPSSPQPVEGEASDPQPAEGDEPVQDGYEAPDADTALDESGSLATGSDDLEAEEESALAAAPLAADPAGFSWKFADIDADTCKINGYNGGTITSGTVHVPAVSPAGKKVVSIASGSNEQFGNLKCQIDFSAAVNLQRIEQFAFAFSGLKGNVDLSQCVSLTGLEAYSFRNSSSLTGLVLPPNLISTGNYAFYESSGLTGSLVLPKSLRTLGTEIFKGCNFTSLVIPNDTALTSISSGAFNGNALSGPLTFPANITDVKSSAFQNNKITAVTFQANVVGVSNQAFQNNLIANNPFERQSFSVLGGYAFANNELSGVISFANDQTAIPSPGIIADNPDVTEIILSKSWLVIPAEAYKGLTSLTKVSVPDGNSLRRVGDRAFQNCTSLQSFDLNNAPLADGSNGNAIGQAAFQGCSSLKEFHVGTGAFGQQSRVTITVSNSAFKDCTALSFIDIPSPSSGSTKISVKIGVQAFMNTNLGDFPNPLDPSTPLGYLPLDRRSITSIGPSAFENANLRDVKLPNTLAFVGDRAFANNHMTNLELPSNTTLDKLGNVGADVLADQTVDSPAVWGDSATPGKADIILEALHALGLVHDRVDAVGLNVPAIGTNIQPDNAGSWKQDHVATYGKGSVEVPGATFTYGYEVWRAGGTAPLSHGAVTLSSVDKGVPFKFNYYDTPDFSGAPSQTHVQWVGVGRTPVEELHDVGNFGVNKPGYHTLGGAYDPVANAGWRTGAGLGETGTPIDPETVPAVDGSSPSFYNRWIANSYAVSFDNNWNSMVAQDPKLGTEDPDDPDGVVPDGTWVSGTMGELTGLTYGEPATLPENGFEMGGYELVGWATSPDLAEGDRAEGTNFFSPGSSVATPDPAPVDGGAVTLYAQWKAVDYGADDPALLGFLSIPQHVALEPYGGKLYSKSSVPDAPADDHAVVVGAELEIPGATWPSDQVYQVSVTRPDADASLLVLSGDGDASKVIQVLRADGSAYDPGVNDADNPDAVPTPLMTIDPHDGAKRTGSFMLASVDPSTAFSANARYAGTMTFRVDIVQKGATS